MSRHAAARMTLSGLLLTGVAAASAAAPCDVRLVVDLGPDVPAPRDPGFLSSLLGNHPGYQLVWTGRTSSSRIILTLTGPGSEQQCQDVIDTMRRDGRVLSVRVESGKKDADLREAIDESDAKEPHVSPTTVTLVQEIMT